jgi:chromosome partitioning protein
MPHEGRDLMPSNPVPTCPQRLVNELTEEGLPVLQPYLPSSVRIRESREQSLPMIYLDPATS